MKKILLVVIVLAGFYMPAFAFVEHEVVSIQHKDMRFYAVKALGLQPDGSLDLLAAGQIKHNHRSAALIIAFAVTQGNYKEIAREVFHIGSAGAGGKTRIRSMVCIQEPSTNRSLVVVNGKAGPEQHEVGFIRSYVFDKGFHLVDSIEFSDPATSYTHGYPLIPADINGDGHNEIVCGGFSGENDRDHADIRVFSIDKQGDLAPLKGFPTDRLNTLRLRINALTSGEFIQKGRLEIVAAGRTVANDSEQAALAVFSKQVLIWKQLKDLGKCRYRYATAMDMNADGRPELVLGGRIDQGKTSYALLDVWQADSGDMRLISRHRFTGTGSTRLRIVKPLPGSPGRLIIGGRLETLQDGGLRWKGFLQQMAFESGVLLPHSKAVILDRDWETRVRTADIFENILIVGGFTEDKTKASTAFISVYKLKKPQAGNVRLPFNRVRKGE